MKDISKKAEELTLEEIHTATLEVLKKVIEICDKIDINYSLFYGSLIGAIRHQGFIPWDDDLDIIMIRKDYDKFVNYCIDHAEELNPFKILTLETEPNYPYAIARLNDMRYRASYDNVIAYESGIFIDIYPLDKVTIDDKKLKKLNKECGRNMKLLDLAISDHFVKSTKGVVRGCFKFIAYCYAKVRGKDHFIKKLLKQEKKYGDKDSEYVSVVTWMLSDLYMPLEYFTNYIYVPFENLQVKVIASYDKALRLQYGDYMKLPPKEQQVGKHGYRMYKR